ncbi:MAG: APC family permease [Phycisphaerales bacterium]|nr:APC family permease [Phycisphaerales bacterium]
MPLTIAAFDAHGDSMLAMDGQKQKPLKRTIGTGGAVLLGLGSIVGTGAFVSIALATTHTGLWVLVAIAIATMTATCNGLSSAQLASNYPVSGGTYEYATRLISPSAGFSAGWLFLCAKSASAAAAALGAGAYALSLFGQSGFAMGRGAALLLLVLVACTVMRGLRRSVMVTVIMLAAACLGIIVFLLACVDAGPSDKSMIAIPDAAGIPEAAALMFVAFTGYGRIATLGEEVRDPSRSIPRAIIITLVIASTIYMAIGWAVASTAMPQDLALREGALNPLETITNRAWGPAAGTIVAIAAIAALIGVLLNLILGLSRVVLAMARRGDMPQACAKIQSEASTPNTAAITVTVIIGTLIVVGDFAFAWSLSAFTVLIYYALTNLAALRLQQHQRTVPRWIAVLGLLFCCALAFSVPLETWSIGIGVLASGFAWRFILQGIAALRARGQSQR